MATVANDTVVVETLAEMRALARQPTVWVALFSAGCVVGLTGPFGTFDALPALVRIAYWLVCVTVTFWIGYVVSYVTTTLAEDLGLSARLSLCVGALAASLPVPARLALVRLIVFDTPFWADAVRLLPYVVAICLAAAILTEAFASVSREVAPVVDASVSGEPAWLVELPQHLGRDLVLLQAQEHYLKVETALGHTLIRAKLNDAAEELGAYGFRLHRSWWVARKAVHSYRYSNGSPVVVLQDGRTLPGGRTYRRSVKDALQEGVAATV